MEKHRFTALLASLVLLMLAAPFLNPIATAWYPKGGQFVLTVFIFAVTLSSLVALTGKRATYLVGIALAVPVVIFQAASLFSESRVVLGAENASSMAFVAFVVARLSVYLVKCRRVSFDMISAAICGYLLMGLLWSNIYSLIEVAAPGSFTVSWLDEPESGSLRFATEESSLALYFSFVTLTTLGYGDIVPATMPARMFVTVEAIMGQVYLTVLVARLVGLHIQSGDKAGRPPDDAGRSP